MQADCHEVKIIEDFSEWDASNVSDDIVENTEDTMTLLERYIDDLPINLSKDRLKNTTRELYIEAQDLEIWFILIMLGGRTFYQLVITSLKYN